MSTPPPRSTYRLSTPPAAAGGKPAPLKITTDRLSNDAGVSRAAGTTSTRKDGVPPIDSAFARNRLASDRSPLSTIRTDTGALGAATKYSVLSAGSGSSPAWTAPRTPGDASVNGAKVTE